jgi:hypothetical protein
MADAAHRLRRLPKPRFVFVAVPDDALHSLLWWLIASLTGRLADWTSWGFLNVTQFAATGYAVLLAVLAIRQWRLRARRR